jgi:hypothetical protein
MRRKEASTFPFKALHWTADLSQHGDEAEDEPPTTSLSVSAMAPRSAVILIVLAANRRTTSDQIAGALKFRQTWPATP